MNKRKIFFLSIAIIGLAVFIISYFVQSPTLSVAMILWRGQTEAEKGFINEFEKSGYNLEYEIYDAGQNQNILDEIIKTKLAPNLNKHDYIYTFGTTVSLSVKKYLQNKKPQIFNIVAKPIEVGLIDSFESSGNNICGVTNYVSIEDQIINARAVISFEKLGVLYNPLEKNSKLIFEQLEKLAEEYNYSIIELPCTPQTNELHDNLEKIKNGSTGVDAVFLPPDSYLVSKAEYIAAELKESKIGSIGSIEKFISSGILVGTVTDYNNLGELFTEAERKDFASRWGLMKDLKSGTSQRNIAKARRISLCKITRGSRLLKNHDSISNKMIEKYLK